MLLDTSAWIEYLQGTEKGSTVKELLSEEKCYTALTTIAEIVSFSVKKGSDASGAVTEVSRLSAIIGLNKEIATLAGRINGERKKSVKKLGMMDSLVLATGILCGLKILTKDYDFKDLPNVQML